MDCCEADIFFHGGNIITVDEDNSEAEALAVKDGKILSVGKFQEVSRHVGPNTQTIKLVGDQTLLPGFVEAHTHATILVSNRCVFTNISGDQLNCYEALKSVVIKKVQQAASVDPVEWALFIGWDPELISDAPALSADKIDSEFCQGLRAPVPVVVVGQNGHIAWANRAALEEADIRPENTPEEFFCRENGKLTGKIFESRNFSRVLKHLRPRPGLGTVKKATREQWKDYASRGFTTVTDLMYVSNDVIKKALSDVADEDYCPLRLALYEVPKDAAPTDKQKAGKPVQSSCCASLAVVQSADVAADSPTSSLARHFNDNKKLWVAGVKFFADGSPHCGTMAVDSPFLSNDLTEKLGFPTKESPRGKLIYEKDEEFLKLIRINQEREDRPQIAIHAHGERAIDQVLSIYKEVDPPENTSDRRHRMEHLGLVTEVQIARAAEQNLALSFFVCQLYYYGKTFSESIFGRDRTNRWTPLALAEKYGLRWTIHQDHPTFPGSPTPFSNLKTAVTRTQRDDPNTVYGKEHCVTIQEAIKAYIINAAWQLHVEDYLGSLEVGKLADLLILDKNPCKLDPMKLEDVKVVETFVGGKKTGLSAGKMARL